MHALQYLFYIPQSGGPEQLIATIRPPDTIEIHNEHLRRVMSQVGIQIPQHLQENFEGKRNIYLNDSEKALFIKAFVEVYFQLHMDKRIYQLRLANP